MKRKKMIKSILKITVISVWLVMIFLLIQRYYISPLPSPNENLSVLEKEMKLGSRWMGIYMKDSKIGYSASFTEKEGDHYKVIERTFMKFSVMGDTKKIKTLTTSITDKNYELKLFTFKLTSNEMQFEMEGEIIGKELEVRLKSMGEDKKERFKVKEVPCLWNTIIPYISVRGLEVGKRYKVSLFDPSLMSITDIVIEVEGYETIHYRGKDIEVARLKHKFKDLEVKTWVTLQGEIIKEETPLGFTLLRETQAEALTANWDKDEQLDIVASTAIPVNIAMKSPDGLIKDLKVRLTGVPLKDFELSDERQKVSGDIVHISQEELGSVKEIKDYYLLPYRGELYKDDLKSTTLVQSGDPRIVKMAKSIIKDEKDPLNGARMIFNWVYKTLEKSSTISIPNAVQVLEMKRGDCNEHTVLFVALARAVGIPSRINVGVVNIGKTFFYHSWPSIHVGKWIAIDPTLNQFPADATHIKFIEGELDKQIEMIKVIGRLGIEILEYR